LIYTVFFFYVFILGIYFLPIFAHVLKKSSFDMKDLVPYDIRLKGLKDGVHTFDFAFDSDFLPFFENAPD